MRTIQTNLYKFNELSEEAKQKAIERLYDINIDYDWWNYLFDDAKEIGLKINSFDIDMQTIKGSFLLNPYEIAQKIINNHGEYSDTYLLSQRYIKDWNDIVTQHSDGTNTNEVCEDKQDEFDILADELDNTFLDDLLECYLVLLKNHYDYITSEEGIIETIECNEYEFTIDGKLY
jgi:hypothetical protein